MHSEHIAIRRTGGLSVLRVHFETVLALPLHKCEAGKVTHIVVPFRMAR